MLTVPLLSIGPTVFYMSPIGCLVPAGPTTNFLAVSLLPIGPTQCLPVSYWLPSPSWSGLVWARWRGRATSPRPPPPHPPRRMLRLKAKI